MSTSRVHSNAAIHHDGIWYDKGTEFDLPTDVALMEEQRGALLILSTEGEPVTWKSCCGE